MITTNVLQRTFRIRYKESCGTCFTIDFEGRQYLVTARHVIEGFPIADDVDIFFEKDWHKVPARLVGNASGEIDITVLTLDFQLSPTFPLPASTGGIVFGQNVYFLGYPYDLFTDVGLLNRNFPLPFIKGAVLSSLSTDENGVECLFLDGHNNPGFSGGPVVFTPPDKINDFRVAAVISAYRVDHHPIYQVDQQLAKLLSTNLLYRYNTGIVISYSIRHATDLIQKNPIGFLIPPENTV